jgi:hypothetical protein
MFIISCMDEISILRCYLYSVTEREKALVTCLQCFVKYLLYHIVSDCLHIKSMHNELMISSNHMDCVQCFYHYQMIHYVSARKKLFRNHPVTIQYMLCVHSNVSHTFLPLNLNTQFRSCFTKTIHQSKNKTNHLQLYSLFSEDHHEEHLLILIRDFYNL